MIFIAPITLIIAPVIVYILNDKLRHYEKYERFLNARSWTMGVAIIAFISLLSNKALEYELADILVEDVQASFYEVETEDYSGIVKAVTYPTEDIRNAAHNFRVLFFLVLSLSPYLIWQILNRKLPSEYPSVGLYDIGLKLCMTILLLSCLAIMPHWYYEIVRWVSAYVFITLIRRSNKRNETISVVFYLSLLWLFNPIERVAFVKPVWNAIDALVSVLLVSLALLDANNVFLRKGRIRNS